MIPQQHLRSYVKRNGRLTHSQKIFFESKESNINFFNIDDVLNFKKLFNNNNPCVLDIGFGDGKLLTSIAKKFPDINFIGIEVYESGVGNILKQISEDELDNLKISSDDAVVILNNFIQDNSLFGVSLFFPDPWPKKKHHKRRIINSNFLDLIRKKIQKNGFVKIATDWSNYGEDIISLFEEYNNFEKTNNIFLFEERCLTKFEKRGIALGHQITDLCYKLR